MTAINQHARSVLRELATRSDIHLSEISKIVRVEERHYRYDPNDLILPEPKRMVTTEKGQSK